MPIRTRRAWVCEPFTSICSCAFWSKLLHSTWPAPHARQDLTPEREPRAECGSSGCAARRVGGVFCEVGGVESAGRGGGGMKAVLIAQA
jgi:hypothetical protein